MWEIISGVIGILGFVISVAEGIYLFFKQKRHLTFSLETAYIKGMEKKEVYIRYRVDNLSEQPISITRFQLIVNNKMYDANFIPQYAADSQFKRGQEVIFHEVIGTDRLPINLDALESHGGYLSFLLHSDTPPDLETPLNFRVSTNRGKPFQMTLSQNGDFQIR